MSDTTDDDGCDGYDAYGIPVIAEAVSSSQAKRRAITEAAIAEFLASGYSAASVDAIASRAAVSKPTVYKHFGSKERLFLAVIGGVLNSAYADLEPCGATLTGAPDLRAALVRVQGDWMRLQLTDELMSLRRLVIGEVERFPQLGRLWYLRSYAAMNTPLVDAVRVLVARGVLDVPDVELAVRQLVAVTVSIPQLAKTFDPGYAPTDAELLAQAAGGVDLFLTRYATGGA
ncbi:MULTISPECIES: TetR/AcrR family transcriptional regulator [unclassified Streptomyces]|uniref:TetR/AcrR family transcriptional regulator n=1 Tax=unclassified Streptomyces TaxID=2593676 RepID=UPI001BE7CC13|nr:MULTISPECIES: TetR/AcrR family transcriptional regulator [unclassified Streptomyces]MBT2405752.1 TetR/AcrR family transcriptional regulator [Streptomyces sp. ISL-21]MBT2458904.1 TetR/AcrR family transcriptional regulator [Streptomyces sp. ISL-86]MBT2610352.1 TetR/AcrR family transcriptional regulator [Streptomyces sp. ISL-87]